jgi:hypothetical protein
LARLAVAFDTLLARQHWTGAVVDKLVRFTTLSLSQPARVAVPGDVSGQDVVGCRVSRSTKAVLWISKCLREKGHEILPVL